VPVGGEQAMPGNSYLRRGSPVCARTPLSARFSRPDNVIRRIDGSRYTIAGVGIAHLLIWTILIAIRIIRLSDTGG
jgi:hypothetical protein